MKISVITINYNNVVGLRNTVKSVIDQSYEDVEYIIIDGGSTDGSMDVIVQNSGSIAFWVSELDHGIYDAMNKGIAHATGDYCIFMNSGDCFASSDSIDNVFKCSSLADIICGKTIFSNGQVVSAKEDVTMDTLFENALCHQSCFIRTSIMKKYGYDASLKIVADRKFFVQALILDNCSYEAVDVDVAVYDVTGFSSLNPVASRLEYSTVIEQLIPERIRIDYGRRRKGALYGDSAYNKLFVEISMRQYRKPVYRMVHSALRILSIFRRSANFVKNFPKTTD